MSDQSDYWNRVAEEKNFTTPFRLTVFSGLVAHDARILDVGCGYGRTLTDLEKDGFSDLIGLDFSERLIGRGKRLHPSLDLRVMRENRLDFSDASVDAVLLLAVLTCIPEDESQRRLIGEIERVLKPGGILYVNDFLLNGDERNRHRYAVAPAGNVYGVFALPDGGVLRHHSPEWIENLTVPFSPILFECETFVTMNGHHGNGFCYIGRKKGF